MLFLVLCVMVPAIVAKTRLPAMYFNPEIIDKIESVEYGT